MLAHSLILSINYNINLKKLSMKYFTIQNNKWEIVNIYNLTNSRQVNLYDFCNKTQKMVFVGIGLY